MAQLYARNCRTPFAPATAFHTDVLIGELFHAEVSAASAGAGGLMDATHTRVWALLRWKSALILCN
jgi:hypothetical protein